MKPIMTPVDRAVYKRIYAKGYAAGRRRERRSVVSRMIPMMPGLAAMSFGASLMRKAKVKL